MSLQSRLDSLITAIGADIKERVTLSSAQIITGAKQFPPNTLLMRNAAGTITAEPYSDINAPDSLERTILATAPATPVTGESVEWTVDGKTLDMKAPDGTVTRIGPSAGGGGTGTKVSALPIGTTLAGTEQIPIVQGGVSKSITVADIRRFIPVEYLLFHAGVTGTYTLTPLTAATTEPSNAPMARILADLSAATQMRLIIGQRVNGAGATSCQARLQYATNGATQTTWTDAQNTGTGIDVITGIANTVKTSGWVDLIAGAKIDTNYMRLVFVTVGTLTTAPTVSWAAVSFR